MHRLEAALQVAGVGRRLRPAPRWETLYICL